MGENIGKIYETEEYNKFKLLKGNRKIKKNISLEQSIVKNGILIPIAVNENFEILDGQSRYEIAKKYGKKIFYCISKGLGMNEVIELNSTKKAWKFDDYINKFVVDKNEEYEKLNQLIQEYSNIPISSLAAAAQGFLDLTFYSSRKVREGKFSFYNYPHFCRFLESYSKFINQTNLKSSQYVFLSYFNLCTIKKFNQERLIKGINKKRNLDYINSNMSLDVVIEEFIHAHNYGLPGNAKNGMAINFELSKKEKPIISEERDLLLVRTNRKVK